MSRKPTESKQIRRSVDSEGVSKGSVPSNSHTASQSLRLTLPLPPSTNNIYANARRGGRILTTQAREYKEAVQWEALARGAAKMRMEPPLSLSITVYFPDRRRRDLDGQAKVLIDALTEAVGIDDSHVVELYMRKRFDKQRPRCEVTLKSHDVVREEPRV